MDNDDDILKAYFENQKRTYGDEMRTIPKY